MRTDSTRRDYDEYLDDEYGDRDGADEESQTITCRGCGREIYEDAFQCPYCGRYVEVETNPWSDRPFWWVLLALLGLLAAISALVLGL
ncbi:MAG: hypothetical protein NZ899_08740 [Thermoguttaceae bacterium]|nr:hypothetical protein [Thermoguttaceae bacterium]MDW8077968.1 hypothetical protein [Thermoguttaceae bacterium]